MLDPGHLRGGTGCGDPDCGHFPGGGADVSGGVFADCLRLRLLPAVEGRRRGYEHRGLEIPQGPAGHSAEIVPHQGITRPDSS